MDIKQEEKIIKKNSIFTMIANIFLAIAKMGAGIIGSSSVLIADAINSISDVATNIVVFISAKLSRKEQDKDHPYGHEKIDSVISIFIGAAVIVTAFEVGKNAVERLYDFIFNGYVIQTPKWYVLLIILITIIVKEFLFQKTRKEAKIAKSSALLAQAWDHRSDTIASFGAGVGVIGVLLGWSFFDPIASVVIALFIFRVGFKIAALGVSQVVDKSADDLTCEKIKEIVFKYKEVKSLDDIKTRMFGMKLYVDLEIGLHFSMSLEEAHEIAERLHDEIENTIPEVLHCMIHINPNYDK
ncbi:MAG: cation transporter [Tenericutes bacterium]|nr:cation transporter [Mycoplasmatota bacterium]